MTGRAGLVPSTSGPRQGRLPVPRRTSRNQSRSAFFTSAQGARPSRLCRNQSRSAFVHFPILLRALVGRGLARGSQGRGREPVSYASEFCVVCESRLSREGGDDDDGSLLWKAYLLERKQDELTRHPWRPMGRNQDNPTLPFAQAGCLLLRLSGPSSVCLL